MNKLSIAAVILVVLLGVTLFMLQSEQQSDTGTVTERITLPKVAKDAIDAIEVSVPKGESARLEKRGAVWWVVKPVQTEADQAVVDTALNKIAELEVTGTAATKEANHARLEVDDAQAIHVVAQGGGKTLIDFRLGTYRSGNTMVRESGKAPTATVKGSIKYAFERSVRDWRNRAIVKDDQAAFSEAVFESPKGTFKFVRDGENWKQADGQAPIPEFDPSKARALIASATNLRAADFPRPEVTVEQANLGASAPAKLTLVKTGDAGAEMVQIRFGNKEGENYYAMREGRDVLYLVSSFVAERMQPGPDDFKKKDEPTPPPGAEGMPQGMPQGMQGMDQLPPELQRQLQQQMQQQMQQQGGH